MKELEETIITEDEYRETLGDTRFDLEIAEPHYHMWKKRNIKKYGSEKALAEALLARRELEDNLVRSPGGILAHDMWPPNEDHVPFEWRFLREYIQQSSIKKKDRIKGETDKQITDTYRDAKMVYDFEQMIANGAEPSEAYLVLAEKNHRSEKRVEAIITKAKKRHMPRF